jgi:hypothetical protein
LPATWEVYARLTSDPSNPRVIQERAKQRWRGRATGVRDGWRQEFMEKKPSSREQSGIFENRPEFLVGLNQRALVHGLQGSRLGAIIVRILSGLFLSLLLAVGPLRAQARDARGADNALADSVAPADVAAPADSSRSPHSSADMGPGASAGLPSLPSSPAPNIQDASIQGSSIQDTSTRDTSAPYVLPTEQQKFHTFLWNAVGPAAFAGSAVSGAINQAADFPHQWGQGADAYGARVASNVGISLFSATALYGMGEAFQEDTQYYPCTCRGFFPRFWHAALSTVAGCRGADGHTSFSIALTISPFVGPIVAANTWIPSRNGPILGARMGAFNLVGQFGQNEALEFFYGGPHTLLRRIERHFYTSSSDPDHHDVVLKYGASGRGPGTLPERYGAWLQTKRWISGHASGWQGISQAPTDSQRVGGPACSEYVPK